MYILRVFTGDETLTYTFQNTSWGKGGDDGLGITVFLGAMKKYYKDYGMPASVRIMNDNGLFYNPKLNKYVHTGDWKEISIPLNEMAEEELSLVHEELLATEG